VNQAEAPFPVRRLYPPAYLLMAIIVMTLLHLFAPVQRLIPPPWTWIGLLPFLGGAALSIRAARLFDRAGTPKKPFERSTRLVLDGPYRFTRNPMYLGMVTGLSGLALLFGTLSPWAVPPLFALFLRVRFILPEEAMMERLFGAEYVAFKGRVRRWL
jgi:protein-S-isoprenylcysteine O-methyltransferase Ste14